MNRADTATTPTELFDIEEGGVHIRHPLRVAEVIVSEVRAAHRAKLKGAIRVDPLDAHRTLLQLKVAGLLALLDRRIDVNVEDWTLAGLIVTDSDATRARVVETVRTERARCEAATSNRLARRSVDADVAVETRRIVDAARKLAAKVWTTGEQARQDLYRAMRRQREVFEDALEHAVAEGWVVVRSEPGQGAEKVFIAPGERKPT